MKKENRVFFRSEREAKQCGFRPCGHCMKLKHQLAVLKQARKSDSKDQRY
jgi:methylphosphotriester-DNA--protein-cysteine methyltransferase